jgi:hypothetical protein
VAKELLRRTKSSEKGREGLSLISVCSRDTTVVAAWFQEIMSKLLLLLLLARRSQYLNYISTGAAASLD